MAVAGMESVILAIIIGTLAAIVYSLRFLVLMERRIARMDINIERMTKQVVKEKFTFYWKWMYFRNYKIKW